MPLTGGFFGKFYIFKAALESHLVWLTVLGLLNSAVAAYYYLRILVVMYMHEPGEAANSLKPVTAGLRVAILASALGTLLLGIFPSWVLNFAGKSATEMTIDPVRRTQSISAVPKPVSTALVAAPGDGSGNQRH